MDSGRFDRLTRGVSTVLSRRTIASAIGLGALALPGLAEAKKHKKKKKKIKRNSFGCVDVGKFCKNGGQCCSGICEGKKDKKTCKGHDATTCQPGQNSEECGGSANVDCTTSSGDTEGTCYTTTGKAGYCGAFGTCFACTNDADCQPICGPQAACVPCAACAGVTGTTCLGPSGDSCGLV